MSIRPKDRTRVFINDSIGGATANRILYVDGSGNLAQLAPISGWSATNVTTDRALNANSYTPDELADYVGSLVTDLITQKLLSS